MGILSRLRHQLGFGQTFAVVIVGSAVSLVGLRALDYEASKRRAIEAVAAGCRSNVCIDTVRRQSDECFGHATRPASMSKRLDYAPWRTSWFFEVDMTKFSGCLAGTDKMTSVRRPLAPSAADVPDAGSADAGP